MNILTHKFMKSKKFNSLYWFELLVTHIRGVNILSLKSPPVAVGFSGGDMVVKTLPTYPVWISTISANVYILPNRWCHCCDFLCDVSISKYPNYIHNVLWSEELTNLCDYVSLHHPFNGGHKFSRNTITKSDHFVIKTHFVV